MSEKFLPLGTAIKVNKKDDEGEVDQGVYVIISRAFMNTTEEGIIAGYQCVLYPQGFGEKFKRYVVKETEVSEVLTTGYSDEQEVDFITHRLSELTERLKSPPAPIQKVVSVESAQKEHEERLKQDPFYKFRK